MKNLFHSFVLRLSVVVGSHPDRNAAGVTSESVRIGKRRKPLTTSSPLRR
jgi:hypothetical protein